MVDIESQNASSFSLRETRIIKHDMYPRIIILPISPGTTASSMPRSEIFLLSLHWLWTDPLRDLDTLHARGSSKWWLPPRQHKSWMTSVHSQPLAHVAMVEIPDSLELLALLELAQSVFEAPVARPINKRTTVNIPLTVRYIWACKLRTLSDVTCCPLALRLAIACRMATSLICVGLDRAITNLRTAIARNSQMRRLDHGY